MKNIECFCDHEKCIICKLRDQYKKRKTKTVNKDKDDKPKRKEWFSR